MDLKQSDQELVELKKILQESGIEERDLEKSGRKVLEVSKNFLEENSIKNVKTLFKGGYLAEEIIKTAEEEKVTLIVLGSRGRRLSKPLLGSVSREVAARASVSVLIGR